MLRHRKVFFYPVIILVCCIADVVQAHAIEGSTLSSMIRFPANMRQRYELMDASHHQRLEFLRAIADVGTLLLDCNVLQPEVALDKQQYERLFSNHLPKLMQKALQEKTAGNFAAAKESYRYLLQELSKYPEGHAREIQTVIDEWRDMANQQFMLGHYKQALQNYFLIIRQGKTLIGTADLAKLYSNIAQVYYEQKICCMY